MDKLNFLKNLNIKNCKIIVIIFAIIIVLLIIIISYMYFSKGSEKKIKEESSILIKKNPNIQISTSDQVFSQLDTSNNISTTTPKFIQTSDSTDYDQQITKLQEPDIVAGQNNISKQELEDEMTNEYEVQKVKPYVPLKPRRKLKLSNTNCNISDVDCNTL